MGLFRSVFGKIKTGLAKTRQSVSQLHNILRGKGLTAELLQELEAKMIQADFGVKASLELVGEVRQAWSDGRITSGDQAWDYLKRKLVDYWPQQNRQLQFAPDGEGPTVILVAGINGSGKTTSIAKIAKAMRDADKTVILAACDTFRAAAVEQLEIWSKRLGVDVVKGQQGGDPAAVAFDACEAALSRNADVLIIDTAGRLHTQQHLMRQLEKIRNVVSKQIPTAPHEVILVLDATTGQNAVNQARVFAESIKVTGIFLAKLDGTAKGGIVAAIHKELGIPVKFIGIGETPDDVEPFDPETFVEALFAEA